MPVFEIEANGKTFEVDAPDQQSALAGFQKFSAPSQPQQPEAQSAPVTLGGMAKQFGVDAVSGAIGFGSTGGDLREKIAQGLGHITGGSPSLASNLLRAVPFMGGPTSEQAQKAVEGITGEFRKPQNMAEEYAGALGQFLPAALGGPGGVLRRGAQVLGSALASETAGQLTKDTAAEPYARLAGGLAGGLAGARSADRAAVNASVRALPTQAETADLAGQLYKANDAATMGVPVKQSDLPVFAERLGNELNRAGARKVNAPLAHDLLADLTKNTKDVYDLVKAREVYRTALNAGTPGDRLAAPIITKALDAAIDGASPLGVGVLKSADREYSISKTLQALDKRFAKVEDQTAATNSGKNLTNKYKQSLVSLKNSDEIRGLKPDELAQIDRVIQGSPTENFLRNWSNKLGGGGGIGQIGVGSLGFGGGLVAGQDPQEALLTGAATSLLGHGMRGLSNRMTAAQAKKLSQMVANRSGLSGGILPQQPVTEQGLLALLASVPAARGLLSQPALAQ